jgi:hypothetical protein
MKLRPVFLLVGLVLGASSLTRTAAAKPLILDLGQGLVYHRAHTLPSDLPAASPAQAQPLVLDLRYTTGGPDAAITLAAWLKFRALPRTPVIILANTETSAALRAAFAEREDTPGLIVLGLNAPGFTPDLALAADPATERRAYDALAQTDADAAAVVTLINPPLAKPRNDEAALAAEWNPDRTAPNSSIANLHPADHGKRAITKNPATSSDPATSTPPPLIDAVLQRAVHLHRALVALRQI